MDKQQLQAFFPAGLLNYFEVVSWFIKKMIREGKMRAAQPLEMAGKVLSYENGSFIDGPFNDTKEVISGYYHIIAEGLSEALEIAKADLRFEDGKWRIEIRPIMKVDGIN
ncbi:MAG: hypothetical protein ACI9J3_003855 [Parvicellaceae bacterium]|jgi:hypothetical protein